MGTSFMPFRFNGDIDKALTHLAFCLLGNYGAMPEEILTDVSRLSPTRQLILSFQGQEGEPHPNEVKFAITPRRSTAWAPHLDVGWLTLTWLPDEGATRVGIRPAPIADEAMERLWAWLEKTLQEQGLLVGEPDPIMGKQEKQPKWWPKLETTKIKWKADWQRIRPLWNQNPRPSYIDIAKKIKMPREHVSHVVRWAQRDTIAHL